MKIRNLNEAVSAGSFNLSTDTPGFYEFTSRQFGVSVAFMERAISDSVDVLVHFNANSWGTTRKTSTIAQGELDLNDIDSNGNSVPKQYVEIVNNIDDILNRFSVGVSRRLGHSNYAALLLPSTIKEIEGNAKVVKSDIARAIR